MPRRDALGGLDAPQVLIIGAGETEELTARALAEQGVTTMFVANRRRERAIALARRFGGAAMSFDALPAELERGRHRRRRDVVAARAARRRGARAGDGARARAAAAADRPRGAARHRPGVRDAAPASRSSTSTTCRPGRARNRAVRQARGAPGRGDRRGGDPGVRRVARLARGAADDRARCASAADAVVDAAARRERGPLGGADRARPRARRGDRRGRPSSGCCTSRRCG